MKHFLTLFFVLLFGIVSTAQAQTPPFAPDTTVPVPDVETLDLSSAFGQIHRYSVTYRENGDAVVFMTAAVGNDTAQSKSTFELKNTAGEVENLIAYQIIREKTCVYYEPVQYGNTTTKQEPRCLEYQEPNYYDGWWDKSKYLKAEAAVSGDTININLPEPIAPNKSGSYIFSYLLKGSSSPQFGGAVNYSFKTLTINDVIQTVTVGISTDSAKKMKGVAAGIQYYNSVDLAVLPAASASGKSLFFSPQMDNLTSQIGQGMIVKYGSYLTPGDHFNVTGAFAKNYLSLYAPEITITVIVITGIVVAIFLMVFFVFKRSKKPEDTVGTKKTLSLRTVVILAVTSFIPVVFSTVYTVVIYFVRNAIDVWGYYMLTGFAAMMITVLSSGVYWTLLVLPNILIGLKKGLKYAAVYTGFMALWLLIAIVIGISVILMTTYTDPISPEPIPYPMMMEKSQDAYYGEEIPVESTESIDISVPETSAPAVLEDVKMDF